MPIKPWGMKQRRKTSAEWTADNDVLEDGELGFETDTGLTKTGRGGMAWADLDYDTDWTSRVVNKPSTFPPDPHDHDSLYTRTTDLETDYYSKDEWNQSIIGVPWDSGVTYAVNDTVSHAGKYWVSQMSSNTIEPGTDPTYWVEYTGPYSAIPYAPPLLQVTEQYPSGTYAGSTSSYGSANIWHTRKLNAVVENELSGASVDLTNNQITLPAGRYYVDFFTSIMRSNQAKARLRDVTNGVTIALSAPTHTHTSYAAGLQMRGMKIFELTGTAVIELQFIWRTSYGDAWRTGHYGEGGELEIYSAINIWQHNAASITRETTQVNNINFPPGVLVYHNIESFADAPTNTWNTTPINQIQHNAVTNASVDVTTHQITLPAGTYYAEAVQVFQETQDSFARIHDVTNNVTLLYGQSGYNHGGTTAWNSNIRGYFTLNAETTIELQNKFDDSGASYAIGRNENMGATNVSFIHVLQINEFNITQTISQDNNINRPPRMQLQERQPSGTFSNADNRNFSTWLSRQIDTVVMNEIVGASLDVTNYQFTLPAGLYDIEWMAVVAQANGYSTRLFNVTTGQTAIQGNSGYADEDSGGTNLAHNPAFGMQTINIDQESTFELQMAVAYNDTSTWLGGSYSGGRDANWSVLHEFYANINIDQVEAFEVTRNVTYTYDANTPPTMIVEHHEPSGTSGGSSVAGSWETRILNTVMLNEITGASLASNQITLPAGSYEVHARAPGWDIDVSMCRIQNITDGTTDLLGTGTYAENSYSVYTESTVEGRITISGTKVFELQHGSDVSRATNGFGLNVGGRGLTIPNEVFSRVVIKKVA